jgi:hypothetical protein
MKEIINELNDLYLNYKDFSSITITPKKILIEGYYSLELESFFIFNGFEVYEQEFENRYAREYKWMKLRNKKRNIFIKLTEKPKKK